ncbi:MAG: FAD-binding protein, partial [Planctomycetaceae bacterium]|nr:FAD-binding protein [Planctomycetaceae bacterium]
VGAGPAGATLARLLAGRCRVLLLDNGHSKCCGGILAPEAQNILAKLNLALPRDVLVHPQPMSVAVLDFDNGLSRRFSRRYVNIDRTLFDKWLVSMIPDSADIRRNARYRFAERTDAGFKVYFTQNGETQSEEVQYLAGADGAFSTLRREFFPKAPKPKQYVAVQHWHDMSKTDLTDVPIRFMDDYTGIFASSLTDFYAWTIPKNGYLILGAALRLGTSVSGNINGTMAGTMERVRRQLEYGYGLKLPQPLRREACRLVRPQHFSSICLGTEKVMLLGEAAGLISPSSAEGISSALISAYHLAETFGNHRGGNNCDGFRLYCRRMRWHRLSLYLKNLKCPAMFNPLLRKWVLLSKINPMRVREQAE